MNSSIVRSLSKQELTILTDISRGLTNDEIGARLGLSESTIKAHVSAMLKRLHAANRAELVARAITLGLLEPLSPRDEKRR